MFLVKKAKKEKKFCKKCGKELIWVDAFVRFDEYTGERYALQRKQCPNTYCNSWDY